MDKSYGIFCMAIAMNNKHQNTSELDIWWDKAIELYDEFIKSEFNNPNQSELDCINEFIKTKI